MSEQIDVQTKESEQVLEQNGAQQEVKAEVVDNVEKQVQPIIIPLQIMPCFYTGPFNNAPTKVAEEPVEEKQEEPVPQKKVRFMRADNKEKKPKENCAKKKPLQIVCAVLLVLVCASMFALSFCGVVEADINNYFGNYAPNYDLTMEFGTVDLIDGMIATTYDYKNEVEFGKGKFAERLEKCAEEMQESLEKDLSAGNTMSKETQKLVMKFAKLSVFAQLTFESENGTSAEIHFILAGVFSLLYIAITATMLALSIAWLVFVCKGKESNLGKVTVCIGAVALVVLIMILLHMVEVGSTVLTIAITSICSLAICGAMLLFAFIYGIISAPKNVRGMVAIKATSAVLVLAVLAFAFAPAIVHKVEYDSKNITCDAGLSTLEGAVLTEEQIDSLTFNIRGKLNAYEEQIDYMMTMLGHNDQADARYEELISAEAGEMLVCALAIESVEVTPIFSLGYFMVFVVAIISAVSLALIFDFVLGGKNHQKTEIALKVIIVIIALFMLAICASAIGIANDGYKMDDVESVSATIGYGIVMLAVMSLFSLAIDCIVVGIANKRAKSALDQPNDNCEACQIEPAVA